MITFKLTNNAMTRHCLFGLSKAITLILIGISIIACSSPEEREARRQFHNYISVIDSCYTEIGRYWDYHDMSEADRKQNTVKWTTLMTSMEEYARKASSVIAPYDSLLSEKTEMCRSIADDAIFYADKFLKGSGPAFYDKFEIAIGHFWASLEEVKQLD